jgi:hypothetical protein
MTRKTASEPNDYLFGLPVLTPEWQARRNDARQQEIEKTQALRAARLAAQRGPKDKSKKGVDLRSAAPGAAE